MLNVTRTHLPNPKPTSERPVVLFVGHADSATGFARVIHGILKYLPDAYDLHHYGINQKHGRSDLGWTLHGNSDTANFHSSRRFKEIVDGIRPKIVVFVDEPWAFSKYRPSIPTSRDYKVIYYGAIDTGYVIPPDCVPDLAELDCFVAFTEFGRATLVNRFREAGFGHTPRIERIAHGVDTTLFFPIAGGSGDRAVAESRYRARRELFGRANKMEDAFIVLNANRNQPHKRIDISRKGFALFAKGKPDTVKLYLHMEGGPSDSGGPCIDDRILPTRKGPEHPSVPCERLNLIYNACDVGINTSEGEGWGLVSFEHAATGAPQIVPRHSACEELWRDAACLIEPDPHAMTKSYGLATGRAVTAEAVAEALEVLYTNPDERRRLSRAAVKNATRPDYQWQNIALKWHALLRDLLI